MKTVTAWVVDAKKWTRAGVLWRQGRRLTRAYVMRKILGYLLIFLIFCPSGETPKKIWPIKVNET